MMILDDIVTLRSHYHDMVLSPLFIIMYNKNILDATASPDKHHF